MRPGDRRASRVPDRAREPEHRRTGNLARITVREGRTAGSFYPSRTARPCPAFSSLRLVHRAFLAMSPDPLPRGVAGCCFARLASVQGSSTIYSSGQRRLSDRFGPGRRPATGIHRRSRHWRRVEFFRRGVMPAINPEGASRGSREQDAGSTPPRGRIHRRTRCRRRVPGTGTPCRQLCARPRRRECASGRP